MTTFAINWLVINRLECYSFYTRYASLFSGQDIFVFSTTEGARVPIKHLAKIEKTDPGLFVPDRASSHDKTTAIGRSKPGKAWVTKSDRAIWYIPIWYTPI